MKSKRQELFPAPSALAKHQQSPAPRVEVDDLSKGKLENPSPTNQSLWIGCGPVGLVYMISIVVVHCPDAIDP